MNETLNAENEIIISFDDVKMKDFRAYWKAVAKGDWQGQDVFFAKVVKVWSFEGDPSEAETYGDLNVNEYATVQGAINNASVSVSKILRSLNMPKS